MHQGLSAFPSRNRCGTLEQSVYSAQLLWFPTVFPAFFAKSHFLWMHTAPNRGRKPNYVVFTGCKKPGGRRSRAMGCIVPVKAFYGPGVAAGFLQGVKTPSLPPRCAPRTLACCGHFMRRQQPSAVARPSRARVPVTPVPDGPP